jgi:hypothetical protein
MIQPWAKPARSSHTDTLGRLRYMNRRRATPNTTLADSLFIFLLCYHIRFLTRPVVSDSFSLFNSASTTLHDYTGPLRFLLFIIHLLSGPVPI